VSIGGISCPWCTVGVCEVGVTDCHCGPVCMVDSGVDVFVFGHQGVAGAIAATAQASRGYCTVDSPASESKPGL